MKQSSSTSLSIVTNYSDEEVIASFRGLKEVSSKAANWFIKQTQPYARRTYQKRYTRLTELDWESIFSSVNYKLTTRLKNGLELQKDVKLSTYYTSITAYAILDHLSYLKNEQVVQIDDSWQQFAEEVQEDPIEKEQTAASLRELLIEITNNEDQVQVMLLYSKGYSYKEIVAKTNYKSNGACRNVFPKVKKKVASYILANPEKGKLLKDLLIGRE